MHQLFVDVIDLIKALTSLFGVISPFIMWWMRRKWKDDIIEKNIFAKMLLKAGDTGSYEFQDQLQRAKEEIFAGLPEKTRSRARNTLFKATQIDEH